MMWRKIINGEEIVTDTVKGPGFTLGSNDTVGVDGWEPVPDGYEASTTAISVPFSALETLSTEAGKATTVTALKKAIQGFVSDCTKTTP